MSYSLLPLVFRNEETESWGRQMVPQECPSAENRNVGTRKEKRTDGGRREKEGKEGGREREGQQASELAPCGPASPEDPKHSLTTPGKLAPPSFCGPALPSARGSWGNCFLPTSALQNPRPRESRELHQPVPSSFPSPARSRPWWPITENMRRKQSPGDGSRRWRKLEFALPRKPDVWPAEKLRDQARGDPHQPAGTACVY